MVDRIVDNTNFPKNPVFFENKEKQPAVNFKGLVEVFNFQSGPATKSFGLTKLFSQDAQARQIAQMFQDVHLMERVESLRANIVQALASILFSRKAKQDKLQKEKTLRDLKKNRLGVKVAQSNQSELKKGS